MTTTTDEHDSAVHAAALDMLARAQLHHQSLDAMDTPEPGWYDAIEALHALAHDRADSELLRLLAYSPWHPRPGVSYDALSETGRDVYEVVAEGGLHGVAADWPAPQVTTPDETAEAIVRERRRQLAMFPRTHDDAHTRQDWAALLNERVAAIGSMSRHPTLSELDRQGVELAAITMAFIEWVRRRGARHDNPEETA